MMNWFLNTGKQQKVFCEMDFFQVYSAPLEQEQKANLVRQKEYKGKVSNVVKQSFRKEVR